MTSIPGLTVELESSVRNELRDGEELWYAGMPSPKHSARRMWPLALFGVFFGGFAAFWISMAAAGAWFGGTQAQGDSGSKAVSGVFMLFPLFGLPFLAVGLAMISSPWWVARAARRSACCVTNQRAMEVRIGRSLKVQSWGADDVKEITKSIHADGTGTLLFARSVVRGSKGGTHTLVQGFHGVPDPRACEEALLALKATGVTKV